MSGGAPVTASAASALGACIDRARSWLYECALPFWSRDGVDGAWGFVEDLSPDGRPGQAADKRLRVQARQVYVFSHAATLGYPDGIDVARRGWSFMCDHAWASGGGWARRLGLRGGVVDASLDLYDQAFALLAIAWWTRASGEDAVSWADRTLAAVDERLAASCGVGWRADDGPQAGLLQNPHMHMLEAFLALHAATGDVRFKTRAETMLTLFDTMLFDPRTGTLGEYYDDHWRRVPGHRGRIVEPGHHYEWVWLLHQAEPLIPGLADRAQALFEFAESFGYDHASGLTYDELLDDGTVRSASHRCWPNTEALKAHLARFEYTGVLDVGRMTQILANLDHYYLAAPTPGTWVDQLDPERRPRVVNVPASTLYHLFGAFSELLRLEPILRDALQAA